MRYLAFLILFCPFFSSSEYKFKDRKPKLHLKDKDFMPSLSDSINRTTKLKQQIKNKIIQKEKLKSTKHQKRPSTKKALFGDLEINISERVLEEAPVRKPSHSKK